MSDDKVMQVKPYTLKQWFKDFVHNTIVHPILPFIPIKFGNALHDRNARWAYGLERFDELKLEKRKD